MTEEEQKAVVAQIVLNALKEQMDLNERPLYVGAIWNGASAGAIRYLHHVTRETGYDWLLPKWPVEQGKKNGRCREGCHDCGDCVEHATDATGR